MGIDTEYPSRMALVGMNVAKQVAASQAQAVATSLEGARQIAENPPAAVATAVPSGSSRPGGVDITV